MILDLDSDEGRMFGSSFVDTKKNNQLQSINQNENKNEFKDFERNKNY